MLSTIGSVIQPTSVLASYTEKNGTYTWVLTDIEDKIGYDEKSFQNGTVYEYEGLSINGAAGAKITSSGVSFKKVAGSITYTPKTDGIMTITANAASNSELYVSKVDGAIKKIPEDRLFKATSSKEYTESVELTADTLYYIYNGATPNVDIQSITYKEFTEPTAVKLSIEGGDELSGNSEYELITDKFNGSEWTLSAPYAVDSDGNKLDYVKCTLSFEGTDGAELPEGISVSGNTIKADAGLAVGEHTVNAVVKAYIKDTVKLTATYGLSVKKEELTEEERNNVSEALGAAIDDVKSNMVSADDNNSVDLSSLHEDIKLVSSYTDKKYGNIAISWNSESNVIKIGKYSAEIHPTEAKEYNTFINVTASLAGLEKTEKIPVTVYLTPENAVDKYAVRADKETDINYSEISEWESKKVDCDLTLPSEGIFGSEIAWKSDNTDVIGNDGKYKMPYNDTAVELTATVTKGKINASRSFTVTAKGETAAPITELNVKKLSGGTYKWSNSSEYPISPSNSDNKFDAITGINTAKAGTHLSFELTLQTLLKPDGADDTAKQYDTFGLEFTNSKAKGGGVLTADKQTRLDNTDAMTFKWRAGQTTWKMPEGTAIKVGHKYTFDFISKEPVVSGDSTTYCFDLDIYDEKGNLYVSAENLSCRSANGNITMVLLTAVPRVNGQEDIIKLGNVKTYLAAPVRNVIKVKGGAELDKESIYEFTAEKFTDSTLDFDAPYSVLRDGSVPDYVTSSMEFKMADGSQLVDGITADGNTLKISNELPAGEYKTAVYASAKYGSESVLNERYIIKITKPNVLPEDVVKEYEPYIESDGKKISGGDEIYENLKLPQSNSVVTIDWTSSDSDVIAADGTINRPMEDKEVTLSAVISSTVDKKQSKSFSITVKVKGAGEMLRAAINEAKSSIVSVDSGNAADLKALHEDLKLSARFGGSEYVGHDKLVYTWTSNSEVLKISDNTAKIYPTEVKEYSVILTVRAALGNTAISEELPITVNLTPENAADKYAVRCDDIAPENFAAMEEYKEDTISASISVPTKGIFGSDISWTSSLPTYLSNTGKYTAPQTTTDVTLTAVVSKGSVMSDKKHFYEFSVKGKKNGSSGGGGGSSSGGGSSYSKPVTSPVTSVVKPQDTKNPTVDSKTGFTDMAEASWAEEAVNALAQLGVISGKTEKLFAPNDNITRAEFAKMIVNAFGLYNSEAETEAFSDTAKSDWYYTYVASAYNNGIISGYDDGRFGANDNITRQDMAVMLYRAATKTGIILEKINEPIVFTDNPPISDYALEAVTALQTAGVINGISDTEFAPFDSATRAQAAKMTYELIK